MTRTRTRTLALVAGLLCGTPVHADEPVQLDPFAQATSGYAACPTVQPPLLAAEDARREAHVRVERGLRCAMEGTCEPGGAYKRDPEINQQVRDAIAHDPRFANTSVWITTTRKWVTLQGCVHSTAQRHLLARFVKAQPKVEKVFDELSVVTRKRQARSGAG
ncbi:MAG TPA: BON domain-containing protein [Casimicrobiaceae bacterium]|nr:BON domain-containing protein [Casimicrobiaceae bacterium]